MQLAKQIDRIEHAVKRPEEVAGYRPRGQRKDDRVAAHDAQPLDDLVRDSCRRFARRSRWLRRADQHEAHRGYKERDGIDEDRERRAHQLHEGPRQAGPADLRDRRARRELAVALDESIATDERREVWGIRGTEGPTETGLEEHHDVELLDPKRTERVGERDREQEQRAEEVAPDQQWPTAKAVAPGAGDQAHQQNSGARA